MPAKTTNPMTPAQAGYITKLILSNYANNPQARLKALQSMTTISNAVEASAMIDKLKGIGQKSAAEKAADAFAAITVTLPTKGALLTIDGATYKVKKAKYKDVVYVSTYDIHTKWDTYLGTLGMGKTAAVEAVLADKAKYEAAAVAYAAESHHCSFCHLPLTDPVSIAQGYGPVCKKKYVL